ncbi:MAG: hypothetical protein R3195_19185 [Gemmatimonadota bacterium]|nr:hypothetical protein [Gemmatimonadota bacterium]
MKRLAPTIILAFVLTAGPAVGQDHYRGGVWGGLGFGWSSLGCLDCSEDNIGGVAGIGKIGGTMSPYLRLAAASNTWNRSEDGVSAQVSSFELQAQIFPQAGDWFLTLGGGIGGAAIDYDYEDVYGAITGGVGYNINLGERRKVALVPELTFTMLTSNTLAYFFQAAFGFYWN